MYFGDPQRFVCASHLRINSAVASASLRTSKYCSSLPSPAGRLKPVPIGSINTRSATSSKLLALSRRRADAVELSFGAGTGTRLGPNPPTCVHSEADPGPPLKINITGRAFAFLALSAVYVKEKT